MKKSLLSLALIMATYSVAQEHNKPYHVNIHAGINAFDDTSNLNDSALYGISASFYEKERQSYALQLGYERLSSVPFEGIRDSDGKDITTDINRYYVNMLVDGEEELSITPYILIGGGYEDLSSVYSAYEETKSQAFLNAGLGFKYRIHENFNITLEANALGKFDSESLDYSGKLGLDYMFGSSWHKKSVQLNALEEEPIREVKRVTKKTSVKVVEKKKKWITPEVVEAMFAEKDQDRVSIEPEVVAPDTSVVKMQENLKALKAQIAHNEALLAEKLSKLENMFALEAPVKQQKSARIKEKKLMADSLKKAEAKAKKMAVIKVAKQKRIARAKRLKERRRLQAIKIAEAKRVAAELEATKQARIQASKEQAAYNRLRLAQEKEEKKLAEKAATKAQQEETDKLYIRNGMVVFAD